MARPRFAISNIAWPAEEDQEARSHAAKLGFTGIEIAPTKLFGPWAEISLDAVREYRTRLADEGLEIAAMQAILFGANHLSLFGDSETRAALRAHLELVARIAGAAGAKACVFGSPRQRDPGERPLDVALAEAAELFREVAPAFAAEGTVLAFEANVPAYGCRFVTTTPEAIRLVEMVDRSGFGLQLDLGTVTANAEPAGVIAEAVPLAAHVHVSEPQLAPVGSSGTDHSALAAALAAAGWTGWISIEMASRPEWRSDAERARLVLRKYGADLAAGPGA